jgi:hypothetical protein
MHAHVPSLSLSLSLSLSDSPNLTCRHTRTHACTNRILFAVMQRVRCRDNCFLQWLLFVNFLSVCVCMYCDSLAISRAHARVRALSVSEARGLSSSVSQGRAHSPLTCTPSHSLSLSSHLNAPNARSLSPLSHTNTHRMGFWVDPW